MANKLSLNAHHIFLYISLPFLHDYEVKLLNFTLILRRT